MCKGLPFEAVLYGDTEPYRLTESKVPPVLQTTCSLQTTACGDYTGGPSKACTASAAADQHIRLLLQMPRPRQQLTASHTQAGIAALAVAAAAGEANEQPRRLRRVPAKKQAPEKKCFAGAIALSLRAQHKSHVLTATSYIAPALMDRPARGPAGLEDTAPPSAPAGTAPVASPMDATSVVQDTSPPGALLVPRPPSKRPSRKSGRHFGRQNAGRSTSVALPTRPSGSSITPRPRSSRAKEAVSRPPEGDLLPLACQ